jgi:hypothetical protein
MSSRGRKRTRGRLHAVGEPSYPVTVGDTVTVLRIPRATAPFIEGRAVVVKHIANARYQVRFSDEAVIRERVVHEAYQRNPEGMLDIILDIWRGTNTPAIDEFFPEDKDT